MIKFNFNSTGKMSKKGKKPKDHIGKGWGMTTALYAGLPDGNV
jgi:hypothetical protein